MTLWAEDAALRLAEVSSVIAICAPQDVKAPWYSRVVPSLCLVSLGLLSLELLIHSI